MNKLKNSSKNNSLSIRLYDVKQTDWDYILRLRNNKKYRNYFYEQHTISKKEHYQYLKNQAQNPDFHNWIVCVGDIKVGYIRILENDVSIITDNRFTSKGIATKVLQLVEKKAKKLKLKKLVGRILIHNKASEKIFVKNNYKLLMYWYEKKI